VATFDWTVWFLVQGPVDNFTQNWTGETLAFLSGIHNKLFTKGGFRVRTKIVLVFGQMPPGEYNALSYFLVNWGGDTASPFSFPTQRIWCLNVGSSFLNVITWQR